MMRHFVAISALVWFLAAACAPEAAPEPPAPVKKEPVKAAKVADVAQDANAAQVFIYSPIGKRDPFRSFLAEMAENTQDHAPSRRREDTESYDIDQYRLTGLITGTSQPKAMIEDPTGRGHVVHIGSRMGKNGGRVSRVLANGIMVVEETRDPTGKRVRLPITIKLPKSEFEDIVQR